MRRTRTGLAIVALLLAGGATIVGWTAAAPTEVTITIRHSSFDPARLTVRAGETVTFVVANTDPIDHEWLIGDEAFHQAHRSGTHAVHGEVPTEVSVPALGASRTTITFEEPGTYLYICHLPLHEAYGMVGTLVVEP